MEILSDNREIRILLIEDDEDDYVIIRDLLSNIPETCFDIQWARTMEEALSHIQKSLPHVCLIDYWLGACTALDVLSAFKGKGCECPCIVLTGGGDRDIDLEVMKAGADDYLLKEQLDEEYIERAVRYAMDRAQAMDALKASREKLRELSSRILAAQERERKLIAREIHDSIGASLTAVRFALEQKLSGMDGNPEADQGMPLEQIAQMVGQTVEEARRISSNLRPSVLDDLGLEPAIRSLIRESKEIHKDLAFQSRLDLREEVPEDLKITIYRIIQEAVNNASKYSDASVIQVHLNGAGGKVELTISDNGRGFDVESALGAKKRKSGLGLNNMFERAELTEGKLEIYSEEGKGTTVRAVWPGV